MVNTWDLSGDVKNFTAGARAACYLCGEVSGGAQYRSLDGLEFHLDCAEQAGMIEVERLGGRVDHDIDWNYYHGIGPEMAVMGRITYHNAPWLEDGQKEVHGKCYVCNGVFKNIYLDDMAVPEILIHPSCNARWVVDLYSYHITIKGPPFKERKMTHADWVQYTGTDRLLTPQESEGIDPGYDEAVDALYLKRPEPPPMSKEDWERYLGCKVS